MNHKPPIVDLVVERDVYSIAQFCARNAGLSRSAFYKQLAAGRGPQTFKLGTRTYITREAAARWRAEREAVAA